VAEGEAIREIVVDGGVDVMQQMLEILAMQL